jgi:hypothetical protein
MLRPMVQLGGSDILKKVAVSLRRRASGNQKNPCRDYSRSKTGKFSLGCFVKQATARKGARGKITPGKKQKTKKKKLFIDVVLRCNAF